MPQQWIFSLFNQVAFKSTCMPLRQYFDSITYTLRGPGLVFTHRLNSTRIFSIFNYYKACFFTMRFMTWPYKGTTNPTLGYCNRGLTKLKIKQLDRTFCLLWSSISSKLRHFEWSESVRRYLNDTIHIVNVCI